MLTRLYSHGEESRRDPVCLMVKLIIGDFPAILPEGRSVGEEERGSLQISRKIHNSPCLEIRLIVFRYRGLSIPVRNHIGAFPRRTATRRSSFI